MLPGAAAGFNEIAWADRLLAEQEAQFGEAGRDPARRIAERIREKAAIRETEGDRLAKRLRAAGAAEATKRATAARAGAT